MSDVSRYVLAMRGMTRTRTEDVRPVFEELFDRMHVDVRFDLEDFAAATLPDQQRAPRCTA